MYNKKILFLLRYFFAIIFIALQFFIPIVNADIKTWNFSNSSDYSYDSSKIDLSSASAQFKVSSDWYNSAWTRRKPIIITGSTAGAQTNYQVKIALPYTTGMKADFSDVRFTNADGKTSLNFWLESETDSTTSTFWVNVPSIPASPATTAIYAYYGNSSASGASNGTSTFPLFDTFGSEATPGDWNYSNNTIGEHAIIKNGKLYAPLMGNGMVILNPTDGSFIKYINLPGQECYEASPIVDKNGYIHLYSCGSNPNFGNNGGLFKINESTGTIINSTVLYKASDWEAGVYDPVNDYIIVSSGQPGKLSAIRASNYTQAWQNSDFTMPSRNAIDPPLIVGNYVYFMNYDGKLFKLRLTDGVTMASTTATMASTTFTSYSQLIYDSVNDKIYATNGRGHTAFAINPSDLSIAWSKIIEDDNWNFYRGGAYHNNVWYITIRQNASPYSSKIYALDVLNGGNILWTNTTAFDNGSAISSMIVDDDYVYAGTNDYVDNSYYKLLVVNIRDGTLASVVDLLHTVASSIPVVYGGKIIVGLWDTFGFQAVQVRSGGSTGDFEFKGDTYRTGYVGPFATGSLVSRKTCDYGSLDTSKWTLGGVVNVINCNSVSTANATTSPWTNYFKSNSTFSRVNTALRVRSKNIEPNSNTWDSFFGFTGTIGTSSPVFAGAFNGNMVFKYDQNGVQQTVTGPAYTANTYTTAEIKMAYPNIRFDVDGTNVASVSNWSTSYDTMPIQFGNFTGSANFDWVLVRNYVYPEPTINIGSEAKAFTSDVQSISPTVSLSQPFDSLSGFSESAIKNGEIKYQISNNSGGTWYWYNSGWVPTTAGYTEANTASDINSVIQALPLGIGSFLFRVYLSSDGTQFNQLNSVSLSYIKNIANGMIFSGGGSSLPTYIPPRPQIVYPDGHVVYTDTASTTTNTANVYRNATSTQAQTTADTATLLFAKDLKPLQLSPDVRQLQIFLNSKGFSVSATGNGSPGKETEFFGPLTKQAVIKFQEKYASEILTPQGLTKGTGYVGKATRLKILELLNK
ncbi:MAG: DUF2341 domain-containing protein [bacterium]